jgi:hypothetical protein
LLLPHCCVLPSPCHCSTCNPPHEQLLMRLGAGGVLSCVPSLSLLPTHCCPPVLVLILSLSHCCPPIIVPIIVVTSSFSCHCSPIVVSLPPLVIVPPAIHPTSSCS